MRSGIGNSPSDPLFVSGSGGGGGGDASAANQQTQIDRVGALTTPDAGSTNGLLRTSVVNQTATGTAAQTVQGADAAGTAATARPFGMGVLSGTATIERARDASSASGTTGTGLLGVGSLGKYNATLPTLTDGQWGGLQVGLKSQLLTSLVDFAGNSFVVNRATDGVAASNGLNVWTQSLLYNGATYDRARGDTNGAYIVSKGGASLASNQVAVTTSATLVVAARTGRQKVIITSTSAVVFYVGAAGVTTANGLYVAAAAGASITLDTAAAVYAIGAAAVTLSYLELF